MDAVSSHIAAMSQEQQKQVEEAYREKSGGLLRFIRRNVPSREDAEDIMQDVFADLAGGIDAIRSAERIGSWLFSVARNRIIDRYRKKKPLNFSDRELAEVDGEKYFLEEVLAGTGPDAVDELWRAAVSEAVEETLRELPEEQRDVFVGHEIEGRSFKEMAEEKGESVNTLLSRKRYAVLVLREALRELYEEI